MENVKDQHQALDRFPGVAGTWSRETKMTELIELLHKRTGETLPKRSHGDRTTAAVEYATEFEGNAGDLVNTQVTWSLYSAFAHARPWARLSFLERETLQTDNDDVVYTRMTSDLARLLLVTKRAMRVCELLLRRHQTLNTPAFT